MQQVRLDSRDVAMVGDHLPREGAPFVLLSHGGGQTRHSWRGAGERLHALGFETLSVDLRGHGETGWPSPDLYALEEFADDLIAWTEAFAQGRPVAMVGASFGGVASLVASTRPRGRVDAIALVDIVPRVEKSGARRIRGFMQANPDGFASLEEAAAAVAAYRGKPPSDDHSGLEKNLRRREDGRYYWHWDPEFMNRIPRGQARLDLLEGAVRAWRGPLLLVRGLQSDVVGDSGVEALRALASQLEAVDVAGAGHMIASDRNDAFVGAVADFLGRVLPVPAR
ncbi:MAG TPA: alpha/beta hydrolase [Allosphingosinicella sp.]|nr:alpha/beta hydrolase [Allosphingosinicella sp.]